MTALALLLGLFACTEGPRSLDNPDAIPDHPLRGQILGMEVRADRMWTRERSTGFTLYLFDEGTPWDEACLPGLPQLGLYVRTEFEPETTRIVQSTGSFFYHTNEEHEIIDVNEGWLVMEDASQEWVTGRVSVIAYDDDGEPIAWAEGAFEGDPCL